MIIDADRIKGGISPELISKLVNKYNSGTSRFKDLMKYYKGEHSILTRPNKSEGLPNTKIVCNHAKYIVDMTEGYMLGAPVEYSPADDADIDVLKDVYYEQEIQNVDGKLCKHMSIYGRAYELVYLNEGKQPRSAVISPENAFVVYDDTVAHNELFGVHYYEQKDEDGCVIGTVANVYTGTELIHFEGTSTFDNLEEKLRESHGFCGVPVIEYWNNDEKQGDFEQLITLIDAYNILESDRVNDKEQFVDAFLFLRGVEVDSEQAKKLKVEKILHAPGDGDAKYLSKVLSETDMDVLRKTLKEDIHRFSLVPDLTDEQFGNNLSGVAIRYKLLGFEQHVKNKERYFKVGLKKRFDLYVEYLNFKSVMERVPSHKVDFVFNRNLPENQLETAQMINYLKGTVSDETLIGQLPFVSDAKEERELMLKQQADESERIVNEEKMRANAIDYSKTEKDIDDV
ncbi:MAG: phage portal protein [Clostridiales bacterium]|nr:phage portal protein [Clostridiales bacterium]